MQPPGRWRSGVPSAAARARRNSPTCGANPGVGQWIKPWYSNLHKLGYNFYSYGYICIIYTYIYICIIYIYPLVHWGEKWSLPQIFFTFSTKKVIKVERWNLVTFHLLSTWMLKSRSSTRSSNLVTWPVTRLSSNVIFSPPVQVEDLIRNLWDQTVAPVTCRQWQANQLKKTYKTTTPSGFSLQI